jgi:COP9 signalosome complex subunit 6
MSVEVNLHPLVLMNISDHFTRFKIQSSTEYPRVIGCLLGTQQGRVIHLHNSFEIAYIIHENGKIHIDLDIVAERLSMYNEVYKDFEFMGWYSTGRLSPEDLDLHQSFTRFNENPLYLLVDSQDARVRDSEKLPIDIYESVIQVINNITQYQFKPVQYSIDSTSAERLAVDNVYRAGISTGQGSEYIANLENFEIAVRLFRRRLETILRMIQTNPAISRDQRIIRELQGICNKLAANQSATFNQEFNREISEEMLAINLSVITKSSNLLMELMDKYDNTVPSSTERSRLV